MKTYNLLFLLWDKVILLMLSWWFIKIFKVKNLCFRVSFLCCFIYRHAHLDEPGKTEWEGFSTGTRAAAAGTIWSLLINQHLDLDSISLIAELLKYLHTFVIKDKLWKAARSTNLFLMAKTTFIKAINFQC